MNKDIQDRVIIPLFQAFILSIVGAIAGFLIANILKQEIAFITPLGAVILGGYWLIHSFEPKKEVVFNKQEMPDKIYAEDIDSFKPNADSIIKITLVSEEGRKGNFYDIEGFTLEKLQRIAFLYCFCGGKLSHNYLDEEKGILNREGLGKLQENLVKEGLAEFRNPTKKGGMKLTENGEKVFLEMGKRHIPSPTDREELKKYIRNKSP